MRFGLDVAEQQVEWDELVSRTRFAEDLGFDGAWGFDHLNTRSAKATARVARATDQRVAQVHAS